jgi:rSAM/selenodomain-associated transferase 1
MPRPRSLADARKAPQRAAPFRCRLIVMVKAPVMGSVKTRLARQIGSVSATYFYRHTAAAVLSRVSRHPAWQTLLLVTPDTAVSHPIWPRGIDRLAQGRGDLGARMQRAFHLTAPGPIVLIGTDIPAIRQHHIAAAFRVLGRADVVFGPAADGGYWLVGMKRRPRVLSPFRNVRWSTREVLSDTLRNLAGRRAETVATLTDVDDASDYAQVREWCARRVLPQGC